MKIQPTGRPLDHVVVAVRNLDNAASRYEELGFTLTPTAHHNDDMGTSNRLVQFTNSTFLELLEVDRPNSVLPHALTSEPATFSFGAHNLEYLEQGEGMSMLVFQSDNVVGDVERWRTSGTTTYQPYHFERSATLPDGSTATLAFSLGFASGEDMPLCSFFVCQNQARHLFWRHEYQQHTNRTAGIYEVILCSAEPEKHARFIQSLFGGDCHHTPEGYAVNVSQNQSLKVLSPESVASIDPTVNTAAGSLPRFVGLGISCEETQLHRVVPSVEANGVFLRFGP